MSDGPITVSTRSYYREIAEKVKSGEISIISCLNGERKHKHIWGHFFSAARNLHPNGIHGSAFRDWVSGLYRGGILIYARNYELELRLASNPTAQIALGCQESCAHGNPFPRLKEGCWYKWNEMLSGDKLTDDVCGDFIVEEIEKMVDEAADAILAEIKRQESARDKQLAKNESIKQTARDAWGVS